MDIRFQNASGGEWSADCSLSFVFEKDDPAAYAPLLWERAPWLAISPALRDVCGKRNEQTLLYGHPDLPLPRVLLCGLGKKDVFSLRIFRDAVAKAVQTCRERAFATIGLPVECLDYLVELAVADSREELVREATVSAILSLYRSDGYRSAQGVQEADSPANPRWLGFLFTEKETPDTAHKAAREGEAEALGVMLARNLTNGPANHITPSVLVGEAQKLAKAHGFTATILDVEQIRSCGMGAFLAVAKGSGEEPRFIVMEHCPAGKEDKNPLVVIGKGITFDSGGISLKPALNMDEMKTDMAGAAAVLGVFSAMGNMPDTEALPRVIGVIPATENMPGGNATRPGDLVTTLSGKTVEIRNTDAEGRLVLCDALSYAQQKWTPHAIIDIATLTGACVVALGRAGTGLFTEDALLRRSVMDAAEATGDLVWPMPLWDEYDDLLKSEVADFANIGPREGGAINAALFLRRFVEKGVRWAHLDIAGPGRAIKPSPLLPVPGGTGVGVRLLCRLMRDIRITA